MKRLIGHNWSKPYQLLLPLVPQQPALTVWSFGFGFGFVFICLGSSGTGNPVDGSGIKKMF
jgi:hypothetical protein